LSKRQPNKQFDELWHTIRHEDLDSNRRVIFPQYFFANHRTSQEYKLCVATSKQLCWRRFFGECF